MLPISLRVVYALNSATFQVSSLALLSIVNTRVSVPATYLPAYGAIAFLPYSLRPIFAWVSSLLLNKLTTAAESSSVAEKNNHCKDRHDKLLFPAFVLASLSFVGTVFIPSGGIVLCFIWGFLRGVAGAWTDFLIGMTVIEFSKLQATFLPTLSQNEDGGSGTTSYEQCVSINTAQASTAKNIGSFVASIVALFFFSQTRDIGEAAANTLLLGTAAIFLLASLVSLRYQFYVGNLLIKFSRYDTINDDNEEELTEMPPFQMEQDEQPELGDSNISTNNSSRSMDVQATEGRHQRKRQKIVGLILISFQILLAVSALQKPIVTASSQTVWVMLIATAGIILVLAICIGYRYEQQSVANSVLSDNQSSSTMPSQQNQRLSHGKLNLYFLLRYSMPIAGFLMYSYIYSVFESEPFYLQLLAVLRSAVGGLSTFCYEKFLSPYCHSGWPLIGLIASLDILAGLVSLLDVWVVRTVREKEVNGEYSIDTQLRCLVAAVGLVKYFIGEIDYLPTLVLSKANVYHEDNDDTGTTLIHGGESNALSAHGEVNEHLEDRRSPIPDDYLMQKLPGLNISSHNKEDDSILPEAVSAARNTKPLLSAGMQYASFLSCIDFGAQIGDWVSVPIIASLDITRENHWDHLEKFILLCSCLRMVRVIFLWLIFPSNAMG